MPMEQQQKKPLKLKSKNWTLRELYGSWLAEDALLDDEASSQPIDEERWRPAREKPKWEARYLAIWRNEDTGEERSVETWYSGYEWRFPFRFLPKQGRWQIISWLSRTHEHEE